MRKSLGVLVLLAGVGGLGLWARGHDAKEIEAQIASGAGTAAEPAIHGIATTVSGRDITASGLADTEAEKTAILAALEAVPRRRIVIDEIRVLPAASPFQTRFLKEEGKPGLSATGSVPSEALRALTGGLAGGVDASQLVLTSGAPEAWSRLAEVAVAALEPLDFGTAELTDARLKITG